ncbi:hypothetical protein [Asticcacaulis sp. AC402]|uniref:hypothetical protein n=1 Tax=Asticcacaulis sp. AC402 TaxID=1282361 RepID=UPI0003C3E1D9|nr:hypothetical protein [Asticcacaulis sp. AC402]ESQ74363.1 hypothetical protein ABAC402_14620 [Asticcacaulis sp. AC402]
MAFICQPQLKDLPRGSRIDVTCQTCGKHWPESVRDMVETRRLGAQFVDLLEFETRCNDAFCGGTVAFDYDGKPEVAPYAARVVTLPRPKVERTPFPLKAVVRPRQHALPPQYDLPMAMPPIRPTVPGGIVSCQRS